MRGGASARGQRYGGTDTIYTSIGASALVAVNIHTSPHKYIPSNAGRFYSPKIRRRLWGHIREQDLPPSHLPARQQRLLLHETHSPGPVYHHQVCTDLLSL